MICSFPPLADENSKILILGTMPGVLSLRKQQYYAHPQNGFWKIMFSLFGNSQVPVEFESRKQLLTYSNIALWDVLESCEREGSLDTNIRNAVANNIPALLASHPAIRTIVFNGKESHRLYTREFGKEIALPHLVMPSTSPANTMKLERKLENWSHLKKLLEQ